MNFPVVTTIRGGSNVDVQSCNTGWCAVRFGPYAGFVKATYLDFGVPRGPRYLRAASIAVSLRASTSPLLGSQTLLGIRIRMAPPRYWGW